MQIQQFIQAYLASNLLNYAVDNQAVLDNDQAQVKNTDTSDLSLDDTAVDDQLLRSQGHAINILKNKSNDTTSSNGANELINVNYNGVFGVALAIGSAFLL
ncbi:uncharacterized protein ASCRUDRAFT_74169 [Ascoidea rubescens DSM 1968]|uniref:Uncharacterized protein n=1 Tax=Ascoidea rubescens DSM 1968 TaxID=1344418 RepID=A0A1D2VSH5_9ASCO|nr:hypothetical protein ASCRUDRAFT_74169 [Ascoidea rubescens DSM 1968]ODV64572.1 hypothetical protein ASCRUDRAFT_74169 [Ascoidea rubescens DSM 1968]